MVSAAGIAPAITRAQAGGVATTPRAVCPDRSRVTGRAMDCGDQNLGNGPTGKILKFLEIGAPDGICTHTLPADNGLLFL